MKRKLVKQGRNALTMTLPSKWTEKKGLKAGGEVDVEETEKGILISSDIIDSYRKIEFDAKKIKDFRNYYLSYFYHSGVDEIRISYDDPKVLEITNKKVEELMGYDIVETGKNYLVVKSLMKAEEEEFDTVMRRAFMLIKSMGSDCLEAIKDKDYKRLKEIRVMEKTNNKFTDFCIRILNKKGYKDHKKTQHLYILCRELERICDNYKYICDLLAEDDIALNKETINLFEQTNGYFNLFYELFYKYDESKVDEFINIKKELLKEGYELMKKRKEQEVILIHHLLNIVSQTFELKGPYIEMNL